jgi:hypothetical protein
MDCKKETNLQRCNCTYEPCSRKGICCQCIAYHKDFGELPACYFDKKDEKFYDRSIKNFINLYSK